jgi:hypothetical protein
VTGHPEVTLLAGSLLAFRVVHYLRRVATQRGNRKAPNKFFALSANRETPSRYAFRGEGIFRGLVAAVRAAIVNWDIYCVFAGTAASRM